MQVPLIAYIGAGMSLIGMFWLVFVSIKSGKSLVSKAFWAIANIAFQPIAGILFYITKRDGLIGLLMLVFGWILLMTGWLSASGQLAQLLPK